MSEFKYACPVCGQHMMCDSSQSGSVMECPTCFQKIVAPQAPADADSKFILAGTKFTEKKIPTALANAAAAAARISPEKTFPLAIVIALTLLVVLLAGAMVFRGKLFPPAAGDAQKNEAVAKSGPDSEPAKPKKAEKPLLVAPAASDANWMLTLNTNAITDAPAAGRIHAQDFVVDHATFREGSLMLRAGTKGPVEFGMFVNFGGAAAEALSGQTINVTTNADKAARISLRWKDSSGTVQKENFDDSYALRLEFGALANNRLPGKIYLCTPDAEKSYLVGTFNADARKPKPKTPKK